MYSYNCYSAIKRNKLLTYTTWMNLKNTILSQVEQQCVSLFLTKLILRYRKQLSGLGLRRKLIAKRHEGKIKGNENIFYFYCAG